MKKINKINRNQIFLMFLFFLLMCYYHFFIWNQSFNLILSFLGIMITLWIVQKDKKYGVDLKINKILFFLIQISFLFFFFFLFYHIFVLKNGFNMENVLSLFLSIFPLFLKPLVSISLYIKFYQLKKKYAIEDLSLLYTIFNSKRCIVRKEDLYKEKLYIQNIFANHRFEKCLNHSLKQGILFFHQSKIDKKLIKSFDLDKVKTSVSHFNKIYRKGEVSSLLSSCQYYVKNKKRYKLNSRSYQYIVQCYQKAKESSDQVIGYAYRKKNSKENIFVGFIGFTYELKEEWSLLKKYMIVANKKQDSMDFQIKDLLYYQPNLQKVVDFIIEIKKQSRILKTAIDSYLSNKIILCFIVFLSLFTTTNLIPIHSLLYLEFVGNSFLFLSYFFLFHESISIRPRYFLFSIISKSLFHTFIFVGIYPYVPITLIQSIFFFTLLLEQFFSLYHLLFISYKHFFKNLYVNLSFFFFIGLLLFLYKMKFIVLSWWAFVFLISANIALYLFLSLCHKNNCNKTL